MASYEAVLLACGERRLIPQYGNWGYSPCSRCNKLAQVREEITQAAKTLEQLENEITIRKLTWQREQDDYEKGLKEIQAEVEKLRKREEEEYRYQLSRSHKTERDEWEEEKARREKSLVEKEQGFADKLNEYQDLKKRVAVFEQELIKAVKTAREEALAEAKTEAKVERDLFVREVESEKAVAKLKIDSLQQTAKEQAAEIQKLNDRLDAATAQLKQIAVSVIQSASGNAKEPAPTND